VPDPIVRPPAAQRATPTARFNHLVVDSLTVRHPQGGAEVRIEATAAGVTIDLGSGDGVAPALAVSLDDAGRPFLQVAAPGADGSDPSKVRRIALSELAAAPPAAAGEPGPAGGPPVVP